MKVSEKVKNELDKRFQMVIKTPASFDFFVAIHDFIEHIESNPSLSKGPLSHHLPNKYKHLKQIHQGLKDINSKPGADLGHTRCMVMVELKRIKDNNVSEGNSFWKKRELFRKLVEEIYEKLNPDHAA
jgi:hypothetical protein